jgi:hypothetical protein
LLSACTNERAVFFREGREAGIFPDYDGVTIPPNIAPLNFSIIEREKATAVFSCDNYAFTLTSNGTGDFVIPSKKWKTLTDKAKGSKFEVRITVKDEEYKKFEVKVSTDPCDDYIAYRLIEPGYAIWNEMGIYQRELCNYDQSAVYENKMTDNNCINCHSFCQRDPEKMMFHLRAKHAGTVYINGKEIEFLNTKTDNTMSALVYPSWHPSGRYVAFSVNRTTQVFHPSNRVEVFDKASDVVVYDVENKTILTSPPTFSTSDFETFPTFSADGRTLYFCSGKNCVVPDSINDLMYSLCSISFNPETATFGETTDTLYNAVTQGCSVSFPRVSPDGRFMLITVSAYGTFPLWHKDADLCLIDLTSGETRMLDGVNSDCADSYHSWSSNSRWVVFSSRRLDGLYTRPYFVHVDADGQTSKPFLLPQKKPAEYYSDLLKSYNIPEFVTGKISNKSYAVMKKAKDASAAQNLAFRLQTNIKNSINETEY